MGVQDELRTFKYVPILDTQIGESIEQRTGLPLNSRGNLEQVVVFIEYMLKQHRDALKLLDESKHLHAIFTLRYIISDCFEPSLQSAREKLENLVE